MAIQIRRGAYGDFDPAQMVAGELAVVLSGDPSTSDGKAVYVCTAAGAVRRIATFEDMVAYLANAEEQVVSDLTDLVNAAIDDAEEATGAANDAAEAATASAGLADTATDGANNAAADARLAAAEARGAVRPDMALYMDYDTVGNIQYISLVDANE